MAFTTVYPGINLCGQVSTDADDPALADALAALVRTALSPIEMLNGTEIGPCSIRYKSSRPERIDDFMLAQ